LQIETETRIISFTIDVEPDFGGLLPYNFYYGLSNLKKLAKIVNKYDLKITAFVTGRTLEENPHVLEILNSIKAEIGQHSYDHQVGHGSKIHDIRKGIETHHKIVGLSPAGYRAPQGIISKDEAHFLENMNIKYDSSVFPTYFPGRFNHSHFPTHPFVIKGTKIMEIPFSVIPKIRIPMGLSYMQLLGLDAFKFLLKIFGMPSMIVFDFHTYELGRVESYSKLPFMSKMGYFRSQRMYNDPFTVFEKFVEYILSKGYKSEYLSFLYTKFRTSAFEWEWN
jgi:peptidoglycan/xylan/chitin deacetylase (PgdA/CDA1 family)